MRFRRWGWDREEGSDRREFEEGRLEEREEVVRSPIEEECLFCESTRESVSEREEGDVRRCERVYGREVSDHGECENQSDSENHLHVLRSRGLNLSSRINSSLKSRIPGYFNISFLVLRQKTSSLKRRC